MILSRGESDLGGHAELLAFALVGDVRITHKSYTHDFEQRWHEHDRAGIDFVLAGGGSGIYGSREVRSSPGRVEFFRDGLRHNFRSSERGIRSMHVVMPRSALGEVAGLSSVVVEELEHTRAVGLAGKILAELSNPDRSSGLAMESLVFELLAEISGVVSGPIRRAGWLGAVRDVLHEVHDRPVPLSELAEVAGVSRGHLVRGFGSAMGMTPGEYHRRVRLNHAARMLAGNECSIAWIARAVGFVDQAHLSTAFKAFTGMTPGAYRRIVSGT